MNAIKKAKRNTYRNDFRFLNTDSPGQDSLKSAFRRKLRKRNARKARSRETETIGGLCSMLGVACDDRFDPNQEISYIAYAVVQAKAGCVLFLANPNTGRYQSILDKALSEKVALVFADTELLEKSGVCTDGYPVIPVDGGLDKFKAYFRKMRDAYNGTVIGVTGSVGKTTTKSLIRNIVMQEHSEFSNSANFNGTHNIAENIAYKLSPDKEFYIQEVGGGSMFAVANSTDMLAPDISVITNVKPHHMNKYKTIENVLRDKAQLAQRMAPGGRAVINFDDPLLAEYDFSCEVISFGIETDREVDFRAANITQNETELSMDITYGKGTVAVSAHLTGDYNAYNVLAAFAAGVVAGISEDAIVRGIGKYRTQGARQNVVNYGSNTLFMDCYNVANETIVNSMKILEAMEVPENGRRIAFIGGENKLGEERVEKTRELGEMLSDIDVDMIVCYGKTGKPSVLDRYGDAPVLYERLKEKSRAQVELITDFEDLVQFMNENIGPEDAVLFKCIVYLNMPAAVDRVFGTGYSLNQKESTDNAKAINISGYKGIVIRDMNEVYVRDVDGRLLEKKKLEIPEMLGEHKIFAINRGLFCHSDIEELDTGRSLRHIGTGAFHCCSRLKKVCLGDGVSFIGEGAFRDCTALSEVRFGSGIRNIGKNAFGGCSRLREVHIPTADVTIHRQAFPPDTEIIYD